MFETWHIGFYVSAIGSWRMSFAEPLRWSSYRKILYKIPSWTAAPISNIPIKVQIQRYRCSKLDILFLCFGNRLLKNEFCQFLMFDLIVYENIQYFKLIDDPISNIPFRVQIQRYRCLKLDILGFMFRQSAHKKWV